MRLHEFTDQELEERWISAASCKSPKHLGNSDHSQCVARGLRPRHDHKVLNGKQVYGTHRKHAKYGGDLGRKPNGKGK
jgi:hypothetical protein